jgi:hypothetical protein
MCKLKDDEMHHFSLHHFIPDRFTPLEFLSVEQLSISGHLRKYGIADGSMRGEGAYGVQTGNVRFRCGVVAEVNTGALLMRSLRSLEETVAVLTDVLRNGKIVSECGEQTVETMYSPNFKLIECFTGEVIRESFVKKRFTLAEMKQQVKRFRDRQKEGLNLTPCVRKRLLTVHVECKVAGGLPDELGLFL